MSKRKGPRYFPESLLYLLIGLALVAVASYFQVKDL